jgi:hypothetical protein
MSGRRTSLAAAACLLAAVRPGVTLAQTVVKAGSEFQVHTYTQGSQSRATAAMDAQGDFVVVWDEQRDGGVYGVFGRRFDSAGTAQGADFQVNTWTLDSQREASLAMESDGDFIVAWESFNQDGFSVGVFAQRFDSAGLAKGNEFQVSAYTTGYQEKPVVAIDGDGDFVVAWRAPEIVVRRFDAAGVPQAGEIQVTTYTLDPQTRLDVAMAGSGAFVITWDNSGQDGQGWGAFARRFDAAGAPQAVEFQVTLYTRADQRYPRVAADAAGDFVVAWQSDGYSQGYPDIFARLFSAPGVAQAPLQVNDKLSIIGLPAIQAHPDIAMESDGGFVVSWDSAGGLDGDLAGVFARRFNAGGTARTAEAQVNSYTTSQQSASSVAINENGDFVIVWGSLHDGSMSGGFAQRFTTLEIIDVDGDGDFEPLTDGLLMLRYAFGFTGSTLTTGAVSGDCTRCSAVSIEAYLDTLK